MRPNKEAPARLRVLPERAGINIGRGARIRYFWGADSGVRVRGKYGESAAIGIPPSDGRDEVSGTGEIL